ncbi:MAG: hypothetical protein ACKVXR_12050 [Planctomycetota bacterium]
MLARLDGIPGVAQSRVDRSGRRFLLTLDAGADEAAVAREAQAALGEASVLEREAESALLASRRRGDLWVTAEETIQLSREEARVLAGRFGEEAALELGLSPGKTRRLVEVVEREVAAAFERVHGRGDALEALSGENAAIFGRVLEACRAFLTDAELQDLRAFSVSRVGETDESECEPPPAATDSLPR